MSRTRPNAFAGLTTTRSAGHRAWLAPVAFVCRVDATCKLAEFTLDPSPAAAFAFYQDLPHEGEPVGTDCAKYIIRTDIMFRRTPPVCDSDQV